MAGKEQQSLVPDPTIPPNSIQHKVFANACKMPYFHYRLHRSDADAMIRNEGDFIVRQAGIGGGYVLSIRFKEIIRHFPIQWSGERCSFEDKKFSNIQDLVNHHLEKKIPMTATKPAVLQTARSRLPWELLTSDFEKKHVLGEGSFGKVMEAVWTRSDGTKYKVAMKTLDKYENESEKTDKEIEAAREEMLSEARILRDLGPHENIAGAFGVTIDTTSHCSIMELVNGGSLADRMKKVHTLGMAPLPTIAKLRICIDTCHGLSYINRCGFIHRDLATRNCLFEKSTFENEEIGITKICDFGMARRLNDNNEYVQATCKMPVPWSALESLRDNHWSVASEVWMFGAFMWEVFNDGSVPYCMTPEVLNDSKELVKFLEKGKRLDTTENIPEDIREIMGECWAADKDDRPPLVIIEWTLVKLLIKLHEDSAKEEGKSKKEKRSAK